MPGLLHVATGPKVRDGAGFATAGVAAVSVIPTSSPLVSFFLFFFLQWTDAVTYKRINGEPLRDTLMMPATFAAPSNYAQRSLEECPDAEWQTRSQVPASSPLAERVALLAVDAPRLLAVPSEAAR